MDFNNLNVLLAESSSRQVLPIAKSFHKIGCKVTTVQESRMDLGYKTKYATQKICINGVDHITSIARKSYNEILQNDNYKLVVPLSDFTAEIFSKNKKDFESKYKVKIAVNDFNVFNKAFDKYQTMKICMENDINCPKTFLDLTENSLMNNIINYPVLIKPKSSCGSIGIHIAHNYEELQNAIMLLEQDNLGEYLVQEFIPQNGKQYNAHFFLDDKSNVKTSLIAEKCRWFPIDGGASTLCRTIHNEDIISMCTKLLKLIGWVGYCDIDLMEDPRDNSIKIIEINARISANVKICFEAGIDISKQLLQLYSGQNVSEYLDYKDDIRLRCIHTDLLWFIKSKEKLKSSPSWFSCKNTTDQIFDIRDIRPFFSFSIKSLLKYRSEMKKRRR